MMASQRNCHCAFTSAGIRKRIELFGFIQCGKILSFLTYVCDTVPGESELRYIRDQLHECLTEHDNDRRKYFSEIRTLAAEIDFSLAALPQRK